MKGQGHKNEEETDKTGWRARKKYVYYTYTSAEVPGTVFPWQQATSESQMKMNWRQELLKIILLLFIPQWWNLNKENIKLNVVCFSALEEPESSEDWAEYTCEGSASSSFSCQLLSVVSFLYSPLICWVSCCHGSTLFFSFLNNTSKPSFLLFVLLWGPLLISLECYFWERVHHFTLVCCTLPTVNIIKDSYNSWVQSDTSPSVSRHRQECPKSTKAGGQMWCNCYIK